MKEKIVVTLVALSLLVSACSAGAAATPTPATAQPTAAADGTIIAEGRLEPIRYADIAFNASGVISQVPSA